MAVYKFSNVSGFKNYQRYNDFLAGNPAVILDNGAYFPLGEFTLASAQSTITFSNIPQTYTHLQVRFTTRSTAATGPRWVGLRFNSDTGSNYATHQLYGDGSSVTAGALSSQTRIFIYENPSAGQTANTFSAHIVDVLDYKSTSKHKTIRRLGGYDANGSGYSFISSGLWFPSSISAITSIQLTFESGDFAANSNFALYGVLA